MLDRERAFREGDRTAGEAPVQPRTRPYDIGQVKSANLGRVSAYRRALFVSARCPARLKRQFRQKVRFAMSRRVAATPPRVATMAEVELTLVTMVFDAADVEPLQAILAKYVVLTRGHDGCRNVACARRPPNHSGS